MPVSALATASPVHGRPAAFRMSWHDRFLQPPPAGVLPPGRRLTDGQVPGRRQQHEPLQPVPRCCTCATLLADGCGIVPCPHSHVGKLRFTLSDLLALLCRLYGAVQQGKAGRCTWHGLPLLHNDKSVCFAGDTAASPMSELTSALTCHTLRCSRWRDRRWQSTSGWLTSTALRRQSWRSPGATPAGSWRPPSSAPPASTS